jgi:hypothetical protein
VTDSTYGSDPEEPDAPLDPADSDTYDTEAEVNCPYCGEVVTIGLDPGSGPVQVYVEDCQVCCQPWRVQVRYDQHGVAEVWVEAT